MTMLDGAVDVRKERARQGLIRIATFTTVSSLIWGSLCGSVDILKNRDGARAFRRGAARLGFISLAYTSLSEAGSLFFFPESTPTWQQRLYLTTAAGGITGFFIGGHTARTNGWQPSLRRAVFTSGAGVLCNLGLVGLSAGAAQIRKQLLLYREPSS